MKLQKIAVLPLAKIFCCLDASVGLVLGFVVTVGSILGQEGEGLWSLGVWSILVFPLVNAVLGFLTGMFVAWSYNLFSAWLGGIEVDLG
jgi:hypothetical protein